VPRGPVGLLRATCNSPTDTGRPVDPGPVPQRDAIIQASGRATLPLDSSHVARSCRSAPACTGWDVLLAKVVVTARFPETAGLEDQPVVRANHRRGTFRPERSETSDTGLLQGAFRLTRSRPQRELVADDVAVMTVNHCDQMAPAIATAIDVRHIHGPARVARRRSRAIRLHPWATRTETLVHEPTLLREHSIHALAIDPNLLSEPQNRPDLAIPIR
jgi:hypothetical protein